MESHTHIHTGYLTLHSIKYIIHSTLLGIYVFTILISILIYILIYLTNVKVSKNHVISAIIAIASIFLLRGFMAARAQVITFVCLLIEILCIEGFLESGKKRYAVGLILSPILLANCHAALFPVYLIIFLPYIAEYLITFITRKNIYKVQLKHYTRKIKRLEKKIAKRQAMTVEEEKKKLKLNKKIEKLKTKLANANILLENSKQKIDMLDARKEEKKTDSKIIIERNKYGKWLILLFVICIFTGLLTPLGDVPYTYMIKSIQGNTMNFIAEHQSVALIHDYSLLGAFALIIVLLFLKNIKIKLADIFMLAGMSLLAIVSYKQYPIFFISVMCIVNKLLLMAVKLIKARLDKNKAEKDEKIKLLDTKWAKFKRFIKKYVIEKLAPGNVLTYKSIVYISLVVAIFAIYNYTNTIASQSYVDQNSYPTLAAKWIKENLNLEEIRLFNDFNYGSYLLFSDIPVFIDGRADVYDPKFNGKTDDVFLDYMQASSLAVWYDEVFKKYEITHIITTKESNLNKYMQRSGNFHNKYDDGTFIVYETAY